MAQFVVFPGGQKRGVRGKTHSDNAAGDKEKKKN